MGKILMKMAVLLKGNGSRGNFLFENPSLINFQIRNERIEGWSASRKGSAQVVEDVVRHEVGSVFAPYRPCCSAASLPHPPPL